MKEKPARAHSTTSDENVRAIDNNRTMIRFCTLCDIVLIEEVNNEQHLMSKNHKKLKNPYSLTVTEEKTSIINCLPTELNTSRLLALKKKCKKIRQNLGTSIATIRSDRKEFIGQKACGSFAVDKPARAKRGLGIWNMLSHHLPKRGIGNQTFSKITGRLGVAAEGQHQLSLFTCIDRGFRSGEFRLFPMLQDEA